MDVGNVSDHALVVAEERTARANHRLLEKARGALAEQRRQRERDERAAKRQRLREHKAQLRQLEREYRSAYKEAVRLGRRVRYDAREAAAWDRADALQGRCLGLTSAIRELERELAS